MTGEKYHVEDMKYDYKFVLYGGAVSLIVVTDNCPDLEIKQQVKAIGCYKKDGQYYYAIRVGINRFVLKEIEHFQII